MSDWVTCGKCGAPNPAEAVTCGDCGVILAAYSSPTGATASSHTEPLTAPQNFTPTLQQSSPGSTAPAPTPLLSPRSASSAAGADLTVGSSAEITSPQTDPPEEFAASQDSGIRTDDPGGGKTSDDQGKRGSQAAAQTPPSPILLLNGSPGIDPLLSPERSAAASSVVSDLEGDRLREPDPPLTESTPNPGRLRLTGAERTSSVLPASRRVGLEDRLQRTAPAGSRPSVKPPTGSKPAQASSRDIPLDPGTRRRQRRDPLSALPGQVLMLAGLGMVLASCLLLALGRPAAMPAAMVLAAFCTAPAGMLLIVVGVIVLVARHSRRSI